MALTSLPRFTAALAIVLATPFVQAQPFNFAPFHASGIYQMGETAGWTVTAPAGDTGGKYTYTIKTNNLDTVKTGALDLSSGSASIEAKLSEPAMLYVEVNGGDGTKVHLGAAVAPQKLQPSAPRPADFDAF